MANRFVPLGPAGIVDPFMARLNRSKPWGSGQATGAIATLAMVQDQNSKDGTLYAGSVSGGIWGRNYKGATDSWGEWQWLSHAKSYEGAQSIAKIKVFENQQWVIAAAGAVSSFGSLAGNIQNPLQVAARQADGSLRWIPNRASAQRAIAKMPVTALETSGNIVAIGTNEGLFVSSINAAGQLDSVVASSNLSGKDYKIDAIAKSKSGRLYAAIINKGIYTTTAAALKANPQKTWQLIPDTLNLVADKLGVRLTTSEGAEPHTDILYVGTGARIDSFNFQGFDRIHRLEYDSTKNKINSNGSTEANVAGKIGNDQFDPHSSFAVDPSNPNRVFAGGNWMASAFDNSSTSWGPVTPDAYTGGLAAVTFQDKVHSVEQHYTSTTTPDNADGTAPHADSRDIAFLTTKEGKTRLIESNDGGIYSKDLSASDRWQHLNDGLRTTEGFTSDWSNIGNLTITAMQDNSVAIRRLNGQSEWHNLTGGDGAVARFDDAIKGSNNLSRAYYTGQQYYFGNAYIQETTFDDKGVLLHNDFLSLDVADKYGNWQSFKDQEINLEGSNYPFYHPFATSPYRAGDLVFAGIRNIYEQIIPHWRLETSGNIKLIPLLEDIKDTLNQRRYFTDIAIGSKKGQSFSSEKPNSWDAIYTSVLEVDKSENKVLTKLYGREAQDGNVQQTNWFNKPDSYQLKDLTGQLPDIARKHIITGVTFDPANSQRIWITLAKASVTYKLEMLAINEALDSPSYILFSQDGGQNWSTVAQSGQGGIPKDACLQQAIYTPPAQGTQQGELYISGYGGVWSANLSNNGRPGRFLPVGLQGDQDGSNFNLWTTDLEYDPVDNVVLASVMGQGTWLLNRSKEPIQPTAKIEPGLRISKLILPQDINNFRTRKGRSIQGSIKISLERDQSNQNKTVSVDLIIPPDWDKYIEIKDNNWPYFEQNLKGNRIRLDFPKGVNALNFYVNSKLEKLNIPDKVLDVRLANAKNSNVVGPAGSVYLYATGETIYLLQEAPGVFYSTVESRRSADAMSNTPSLQAQELAILMPRSNLRKGQQLYWYPVNSDGSIEVEEANGKTSTIPIDDPRYATKAKPLLQLLATANLDNDPRAFSPDKASQAFTKPTNVLESEGISIGTVTSSDNTKLPSYNGRFAFALSNPSGKTSFSPQGLNLDARASLDNVVNFGSLGIGTEVVLAPALGEIFVVDDSYANKNNYSTPGRLKCNLNVANFGQYISGYGLFRVDDPSGAFHVVDGQQRTLEPGSLEYAKEAFKRSLSNSVDGITGQQLPTFGKSSKTSIDLAVGNSYGIYMTPNRILNASSQIKDLSTFIFSIKEANSNKQQMHVSMGTGYFSFEEKGLTPSLSDNDYNDLQFYIEPLSSSNTLA